MSRFLPIHFYANLELFPALLLHGQNSPIMAHIQERMSLLLPAHWFCDSHRFSPQSKPSHIPQHKLHI